MSTDVLMPEMDGRELVDLALERHPDLKILFTTGYAGSVALSGRVNDQSVHMLMKPYTIDDLVLRLNSLLDVSD